ncbi:MULTISPECIES: hypothetical protein [Flavobacterium]|uniref:Uncharacterized protein n=1 Tax=Flavobacterium jumunjinense TaxID=998845 RepID=A0ABV5GNL8_9FLAO|nr:MULTISPECIES: hypothetical protein [Flavobacterium]
MKQFFKYEKGFININETDLFLTKTGNWSEIDLIEEKSFKSKSQNTIKKVKTYSFYAMLVSFSLLLFINIYRADNKILLTTAIILLIVSSFNYIKVGSGSQYKIPLSKIDKMDYSFKSLKIYFKNKEGKEDFERLENIEEKGITILKKLGYI